VTSAQIFRFTEQIFVDSAVLVRFIKPGKNAISFNTKQLLANYTSAS